jgi:threonine aldolase
MVPVDEIKKISEYCRSKNIKLHLDGAGIYLASAWSGVSIKEYSSYFDTVYISYTKILVQVAAPFFVVKSH